MKNLKEKLSNEGPILSWILLITLAVIWGSSFILIKKGLVSFSPLQVGTLRISFAFLVMLPFAVKSLTTTFKQYWKKILVIGFFSNLFPAYLFATAETGISSSLAGILNALTPIMTFLAGVFFFSTNIKILQVVGLLVGFVGSFALSFINSVGGLGEFNHYALFVVLATMMYGFSGNFIKKYLFGIHPVTLTALAMFTVGPLSIIILLSSDFIVRLSIDDSAMVSLGYIFLLGAIGTAFALVLFNRLIQRTTAVFASSVTYLIPITAVVWGILDGENFFVLHIFGMGFIIMGIYLINKRK
jgi:drug/metabolite transporter (DMT)-like permease